MNEQEEKPRTSAQNRALHVLFELVAEALNDAGYDQKKTFEKLTFDIPWTKNSVKYGLWRPLQEIMFGKHSTTELSKQEEIDQIHETLMRELGEKLEIEYIPFPHREDGDVDEDGRVFISNTGTRT